MTPAMSNHNNYHNSSHSNSNSNSNHQNHRNPHHGSTTAAKDAALLETMDESATMGLHRSNLMRLQVTELLQECQIPELAQTSWALESHEYLVQLTDLVQQLPSFQHSSSSSSSSSSQQLLQQRSDKPVSVKYDSTSSSKSTGSSTPTHKNHSAILVEPIGCTKTPVAWTKPTGNAKILPTFTLMVQLPTSIFATKDYLDYRYMDKRNIFIHQVAQHLVQHSKKLGSIRYQWATASGSPHLQLIPPPSSSSTNSNNNNNKNGKLKAAKFQVHLHFGLQSIDWIPNPLRLVPNRCNLKTSQEQQQQQDEQNNGTVVSSSSSSLSSLFASQWYNHCLLHDARHLFEDAELSWLRDNHNHTTKNEGENNNNKYCHPNVEATLILIQVWALQRGLWRNHDGWTKEHVALLVLYLLRTHKMNPRMTPIQLFTVVLQTWATTNWLGHDEMTTTVVKDDDDHTPTLRAAHSEAHPYSNNNNGGGGSSSTLGSKQKRSIVVLPLEGYSEVQTIQRSELAKLYQQQTKESPLTKDDPRTLVDAYALLRSYQLGPVFLDPTMTYNYLGGVSPNYMKLLQVQAKKSLLQQQSQSKSSFGHLFMNPIRFWSQWDIYVQIPVLGVAATSVTGTGTGTKQDKKTLKKGVVANKEEEWEASTRRLVQILERALGNRIHGMRLLSTGNGNLQEVSGGGDDKDQDSDQFPNVMVTKQNAKTTSPTRRLSESPTGTKYIVLGLSVNPETSQRIVDRGPPAENTQQVQSFVELWGNKAQLRRFKDGAIVQAVIWNDHNAANDNNSSVRFCNEDRLKAGIVERIVRHIVGLHHSSQSSTDPIHVALPNLLSILDGVAATSLSSEDKAQAAIVSDPAAAHRNVMLAFDSLSDFLRKNSLPSYPGSTEKSKLGLPLAIDAVEPLSPCLRYSELFPPIPHPFLGGGTTATSNSSNNKVSGVVTSDPILIQIRFGPSSKWPNDLKAMGAAKTAMLIQLCNGIESMGKGGGGGFDGPILVTPHYAELGYKGYCFRIMVRADPELRMLQGLHHPTREAAVLLQHLTRKHVLAASHHSTIHAVHTLHPSAGAVVRMAKRWVSGHLLSRLISLELIELLVAKVYDDDQDSPLGAPGTVATGFLRFLRVLATHDWLREPLIVNPRGHINDGDRDEIMAQFERTRGPKNATGPPMYVIAPYNRQDSKEDDDNEDDYTTSYNTKNNNNNMSKAASSSLSLSLSWTPSVESPEWVVVSRATALAKRSLDFLTRQVQTFDNSSDWSIAFQESASSLQSYSVLLRVDPDFVIDPHSSSTSTTGAGTDLDVVEGEGSAYTRSMLARLSGPKPLRRKLYRNLRGSTSDNKSKDVVLLHWDPIEALMTALREKFGHLAVFFYNELSPEVIAVRWRPDAFTPMPFSIMTSEYVQPGSASGSGSGKGGGGDDWNSDSLVARHSNDILRDMSQYYEDIVTTIKVFEEPHQSSTAIATASPSPSNKRRKVDSPVVVDK